MFCLIKRTWVVEETVCKTHKQYNAYEVWKLFGVEVYAVMLYENGKLTTQAHQNEGLFSRVTFLSASAAQNAIRERKRHLCADMTKGLPKAVIYEEE